MRRDAQCRLVKARDRFFEYGEISDEVRADIAVSWQRSVLAGITPEYRVEPRFTVARSEKRLRRAAGPVAAKLLQDIGENRAAMLLLDPDGVVAGMWSKSSAVNRLLDDANVGPGRIFDEQSAGTSGLGTPLETRRPAIVEGAEHVLDHLDPLSAVGAPIIHPTSGTVEGIVDIVSQVGMDVELMYAAVTRAAREIADRLVTGYAAEDRTLMDAFLATERRGPKRAVIALNDRLLIGNSLGNALSLGPLHKQLWAHSRAALETGEDRIEVLQNDASPLIGRVSAADDDSSVGAIVSIDSSGKSSKPPEEIGSFEAMPQEEYGRGSSLLEDAEREVIVRALARVGGNRGLAAELLDISRATLYRKMAKLWI
ncbi:helix-turn-helix domain-containing protein [Brevibacterium sp. UCMA 11754]|uniref:helix-turn-helix domain-containing protein n=1 Tax=Brevibacterium sp. UCMA 11754 TaxID=2749198 RepID=UPI001F31E92C|nr:helix-turn-helix domain-containing protein [Brevibacterium sp. UCMA 11754]MCF2571148.1 hypothetical protein [Brevibacterium sp. UCMA 11754]